MVTDFKPYQNESRFRSDEAGLSYDLEFVLTALSRVVRVRVCQLHDYTTRFYRATACNATHGIAVGILSVRLSVRLFVRCVYCDKTKQRTANILIPHETAITLVFRNQQWLVGDAPFPLKSALKVTHPPSKNADFDRFPPITSQP